MILVLLTSFLILLLPSMLSSKEPLPDWVTTYIAPLASAKYQWLAAITLVLAVTSATVCVVASQKSKINCLCNGYIMSAEETHYVISANDEETDGQSALYFAPLPTDDRRYLIDKITPTLRPMTDDEYIHGPAVFLHSMAPHSYIMQGNGVFWCVEWDPGLFVVKATADGSISWTALRSPIPEFGGRQATQEEIDQFDEDAENHQYNLVFTPWDAQFSADDREDYGFVPIDAHSKQRYIAALAHLNELASTIERRFSSDLDQWRQSCIRNVAQWAGDGIR